MHRISLFVVASICTLLSHLWSCEWTRGVDFLLFWRGKSPVLPGCDRCSHSTAVTCFDFKPLLSAHSVNSISQHRRHRQRHPTSPSLLHSHSPSPSLSSSHSLYLSDTSLSHSPSVPITSSPSSTSPATETPHPPPISTPLPHLHSNTPLRGPNHQNSNHAQSPVDYLQLLPHQAYGPHSHPRTTNKA